MKITICGSMQFEPKMAELSEELQQRGYEVDKPNMLSHNYKQRRGYDGSSTVSF